MQARALVHMGHKNHLKQAVNMLQEVSNMCKADSFYSVSALNLTSFLVIIVTVYL